MEKECNHEYEYKETILKTNYEYSNGGMGYTGKPTSQTPVAILVCKKCADVKAKNLK